MFSFSGPFSLSYYIESWREFFLMRIHQVQHLLQSKAEEGDPIDILEGSGMISPLHRAILRH